MAGRNPAVDLDAILTGSGLRSYLAACRRDNMEAYDALMEASAQLQRAIIKAGGGQRFLMGVDTRVAARRITKPIRHAAELHLAAARAEGTAWAVYMMTLGTPAPSGASRGTVFDPTQ